jgi:hypothetical protein
VGKPTIDSVRIERTETGWRCYLSDECGEYCDYGHETMYGIMSWMYLYGATGPKPTPDDTVWTTTGGAMQTRNSMIAVDARKVAAYQNAKVGAAVEGRPIVIEE